ncbi:hypothetical protein [Streptomyces sp. NPDC089919]|uniref:hypothetical protein n=1 Tax=Streptomyces sp. NPDC089919 TaxID=3155188 RepID=UPI003427532C
MSERIRPGSAPGVLQTAGTMFAALHGEFTPHPPTGTEPVHDAYSLFLERSVAMGWHDDRSAGGGSEGKVRHAAGLWAMNDAGSAQVGTAQVGAPATWFQVDASAVADDRPLPVQPFLRCAEDATRRLGTLRLTAVQLLLPVQGLRKAVRPAYAPVPSMLTADWFAGYGPRPRTPVRIHLNAGRETFLSDLADRLAQRLHGLDQPVYTHTSHHRADQDPDLTPPFHPTWWNGPAPDGATLLGELAEWSLDAIGWTAETLADLTAALGVRSALLFTIRATGPTN